jgi:hypothetical protein
MHQAQSLGESETLLALPLPREKKILPKCSIQNGVCGSDVQLLLLPQKKKWTTPKPAKQVAA